MFDALWRDLTGDAPGPVGITGAETVLPGPFRVAAAASASVAAATLAAADLLRLRGIEPGVVRVDTRHAAAAFRSEKLVRVDGEPPGDVWAVLSGDYRATDGWVKLHCNYPHHAAAVRRALGVPEDRDAVAVAVGERDAWDVQESVVADGGAAAAMRTREQWLGSPMGRALDGAPLVAFEAIGPASVRPLPESPRPLGGMRVLDLTHVIAGPVAGRVLAAHGADVLHVGAAHLPTVHPLVVDTGMGKRSAHLDLRTADGRAALWRLIGEADVLLQSFRPGALAGLGFTADRLAWARPGIVLVELNAWGWHGPWRQRRGFDSLVQMASGIAWGDDGPRPLPVQALDHATGWLAAAAAMIALRRRATEGGSLRARLALARTGRWLDSLGRCTEAGATVDVSGFLAETDSGFGRLRYVTMPGSVPGAEPGWSRPSPVPGSSPAEWLRG
ncbi:CoA transferase [Amycolatopsis endophytica]|uniref:Crotonobetainyl-CoA:carnitine CoA-transferase CaiB-like acyl-CoA transferase n=1 Tax=Amycolatopsis endophytica TaxID=860233 RepID=A0A853B5Z6_9PSEU|nr:CoA transferase [Amycolatopsis endophytica]NYI90658.1 crotonobetainyl-CoA:carnitine CoA-transferase CaiB-like acyl-CoA transferase [Amycolatopsis endophytica]